MELPMVPEMNDDHSDGTTTQSLLNKRIFHETNL